MKKENEEDKEKFDFLQIVIDEALDIASGFMKFIVILAIFLILLYAFSLYYFLQ